MISSSRARRINRTTGGIAAVVGLWLLVSVVVWFLVGDTRVNWYFWSTFISGLVILVSAAVAGLASERIARGSGAIAAVFGLWILVTVVFWFLVGGGGRVGWFFWSTVISGIVVLVLGAIAGYFG
jgi:hypothetical protein